MRRASSSLTTAACPLSQPSNHYIVATTLHYIQWNHYIVNYIALHFFSTIPVDYIQWKHYIVLTIQPKYTGTVKSRDVTPKFSVARFNGVPA